MLLSSNCCTHCHPTAEHYFIKGSFYFFPVTGAAKRDNLPLPALPYIINSRFLSTTIFVCLQAQPPTKPTQRGVEVVLPIMTCNWIKFVYQRNTYVVDLDRISNLACAENGRLRFSLPDGKGEVIVHPKMNPEAYQQILDYVEEKLGQSLSRGLKG